MNFDEFRDTALLKLHGKERSRSKDLRSHHNAHQPTVLILVPKGKKSRCLHTLDHDKSSTSPVCPQ